MVVAGPRGRYELAICAGLALGQCRVWDGCCLHAVPSRVASAPPAI